MLFYETSLICFSFYFGGVFGDFFVCVSFFSSLICFGGWFLIFKKGREKKSIKLGTFGGGENWKIFGESKNAIKM